MAKDLEEGDGPYGVKATFADGVSATNWYETISERDISYRDTLRDKKEGSSDPKYKIVAVKKVKRKV